MSTKRSRGGVFVHACAWLGRWRCLTWARALVAAEVIHTLDHFLEWASHTMHNSFPSCLKTVFRQDGKLQVMCKSPWMLQLAMSSSDLHSGR
jgi:hypothetical protein